MIWFHTSFCFTLGLNHFIGKIMDSEHCSFVKSFVSFLRKCRSCFSFGALSTGFLFDVGRKECFKHIRGVLS